MTSAKRFRADIQGLRAIAVLSVVAYHASASLLPGGYVGVDIFFVISGYLITGILMKEIDGGRFSIADFYERRVRRLFPALFTMLAACIIAGAIWMTPWEYEEFAKTTLGAVFFVSNAVFYKLTDYFADLADFKPLLHTWSLAIEEQFYLLFPLLLFVGQRYARKLVLPLVLLIGAVSLGLCVWMTGVNRSMAFFMTPYRAFELAIGAAAALTAGRSPINGRAREVAAGAGLVLIVGSLVLLNDASLFPSWLALLPCAGAALIILAGEKADTAVGRLIGLAPMVFIGNLSYSLYLWHWPVLAFGRLANAGPLDAGGTALAVALAFALAWASYRWIEKPLLKSHAPERPRAAWRRKPLQLAVALMLVGAGTAAALNVEKGLPQRFTPEELALFNARFDWSPVGPSCHAVRTEIPYSDSCIEGDARATPSVAVWADSEGSELADALGERLSPHHAAVMQITSSGCGPSLGFDPGDRVYCVPHNQATIDALVKDARIRTVVMTAYYSAYWKRPAFAAGFASAARRLHAAGKKIVLVYPVPTFAFDPPSALGKDVAHGVNPAMLGESRRDYEATNMQIIAWLDGLVKETDARTLKPENVLCDDTRCHAWRRGVGSLYANATHLGMAGERYVLQQEDVDQLWPWIGDPT
jgi:peptidoglycan/LPS O-acetylase OafA/YrhL